VTVHLDEIVVSATPIPARSSPSWNWSRWRARNWRSTRVCQRPSRARSVRRVPGIRCPGPCRPGCPGRSPRRPILVSRSPSPWTSRSSLDGDLLPVERIPARRPAPARGLARAPRPAQGRAWCGIARRPDSGTCSSRPRSTGQPTW